MKKSYFKLSIQVVSFAFLCSCQQELLQTEEEYSQKSQQSTIQQLLRNQLEQKDPQLVSKVDRLKVKKSSGNARIYTDSENGFSVDTEKTIYVEDTNGNKTYTFKIERNNPNSGFLENLILKQTGISEYAAYIVKYDQMAVENLGSIAQSDLKNHITFTPLGTKTGTEVFGKYDAYSSCNVMMPYASNWVYVGGTMCYENAHDYAHIGDCVYQNDPLKAPTQGYATYEVSYGLVDICGSGGGSGGVGTMSTGGGTTPMGGGGSGGSTFTDDCTKVKKPFNDLPTLKSRMQTLATKVSDTNEHAITSVKNPDPANPIVDVPLGTSGAIDIPMNPTNIYTIVAHTHNSPKISTYSVPGWGDLQWIFGTYQIYHKVDSNTVFIVITADGTRYALTISNWEDFTRIFYLPKNTTPEELQKGEVSRLIAEEYYGENVVNGTVNTGLIKENNTDYEKDLVYFLKMIKENNMGINVFELNSDYTQFTRLVLKNNNTQVDRKPCNN